MPRVVNRRDKVRRMTMTSRQTILDRKAGRDRVAPIVDLARGESATLPPEGVIAFWSILREEAERQLPPPPKPQAVKPMSDHVASVFASETQMPYGKHRGMAIAEIAEIDPQYLFWLAERRDEFQETLCRYIANPNVREYLNRHVTD